MGPIYFSSICKFFLCFPESYCMQSQNARIEENGNASRFIEHPTLLARMHSLHSPRPAAHSSCWPQSCTHSYRAGRALNVQRYTHLCRPAPFPHKPASKDPVPSCKSSPARSWEASTSAGSLTGVSAFDSSLASRDKFVADASRDMLASTCGLKSFCK